MSDQRINLAEWREFTSRYAGPLPVSPSVLLALAEAVELAQRVDTTLGKTRAVALGELRAALAKFDFGPRP